MPNSTRLQQQTVPSSGELLPFVLKLLDEAANRQSKAFLGNKVKSSIKADHSLVSALDVDIENLWLKTIQAKYPSHSIHGEETGEHHARDQVCWYLDPIDGTSNFLSGNPQYAAMIAVTHRQKPLVTAVAFPQIHQTLYMTDRISTRTISSPLPTPEPLPLTYLTLVADSGKTKSGRHQMLQALSSLVPKCRSIRIPGCVAYHLVPLLTGIPTISLIHEAPIHDLLPLAYLFGAAGYTNYNGAGDLWQPTDVSLVSIPENMQATQLKSIFSNLK